MRRRSARQAAYSPTEKSAPVISRRFTCASGPEFRAEDHADAEPGRDRLAHGLARLHFEQIGRSHRRLEKPPLEDLAGDRAAFAQDDVLAGEGFDRNRVMHRQRMVARHEGDQAVRAELDDVKPRIRALPRRDRDIGGKVHDLVDDL
jgi:hypothetical protein